MPTNSNIKTHKRYWDQPYSLVRAHVGSNNPLVGGNTNFNYNANAWSPPIAYNEQATYFAAITGGNGSAIGFSSVDIGNNGILIISNDLPTEVFTVPYTGLDSVMCEAVPGSTWQWSVYAHSLADIGYGTTVDMHIFGLNEAGDMLSWSSANALGSFNSTITAIPSNKTNYVSTAHLSGSPTAPPVLLTGTATLADDLGTIRYISMRLDINSSTIHCSE
jgi:hypothetical protein